MLRPPDQFFWRWTLAVYWALLFVSTHIPTAPVTVPTGGDKLAHFVAYALLAWLLAAAWRSHSPVLNWSVWVGIIVVAVGYAALDEWMQPLFGRHCSSADWLADASGATTGLAAYAIGAFVTHRSRRQDEGGPPVDRRDLEQ